MKPRILVVDDEETQRRMLQKILIREDYEVQTASGGKDALEKFKEKNADVVVTDVRMPDMDGLQLFREIKKINEDSSVILITAYGNLSSAVEAMANGASYYLEKPLTPLKIDHLKVLIKKAIQNKEILEENKRLREEVRDKYGFGSIVGHSEKMQEIYADLKKVAESDVTVLLLGETGTGKELAARAIHYNSSRKRYPFRKVSCASSPETLLESTLFGHEKGAYTGADSRQIGMFESADKGTIFLDEIGEINQSVQIKLLRFLQEKKLERVGGTQTIQVDARVIAATNVDLEEAVKQNKFRKDLYYRLNVVSISMPPLRERKEDIPLLVDHFLEKYKDKNNGKIKQLSQEALLLLKSHTWPGNVRELENCIERAIVMGENNIIKPSDLPSELQDYSQLNTDDEKIIRDIPTDGVSLDDIERDLIIKALKKTGGNQTEAAKILGITRRQLQYRMGEKYYISPEEYT
ncbi:response regulator [Candidatus Poribacteria bacterium]|nr:response regulator [Candidatus Poribacteria bacterium]